MKQLTKNVILKRIKKIRHFVNHRIFKKTLDSGRYWERRYATGGNSGSGSYGKLSEYKACFINEFVEKHSVNSIAEFGCGDGNQLELAKYPEYVGYDVSKKAIDLCKKRFANDSTKKFYLLHQNNNLKVDLVLSLDVIFHLVEDAVYEDYMKRIFSAAERYVIIYSSNKNEKVKSDSPHLRHRKFTSWIAQHYPNWYLYQAFENPHAGSGFDGNSSFASFFVFENR